MCNMPLCALMEVAATAAAAEQTRFCPTKTTDYIRTPEDEENYRSEAEWKQKRNRETIEAFLRRNPSGRVAINCLSVD